MSFLRKLGRAIDPTSKTSPLGGVVRMGIGAIPGGNAALEAVNTAAKTVRVGGVKAPADPKGPAPTASTAMPAVPGSGTLAATDNRRMLMYGGAAVAVVLLIVLLKK